MGRDIACLHRDAAANPQLGVNDGWIEKYKVLFSSRRAVVVHQGDGRLDHPFGQLGGIGDRRGGQKELWRSAVERTHAPQPSQQISHVTAKNATVAVYFVNDNIAQITKEPLPLRMVRENTRVKHVRVGDEESSPTTDSRSLRTGGVPVIGEDTRFPFSTSRVQIAQLILSQRLGREQV